MQLSDALATAALVVSLASAIFAGFAWRRSGAVIRLNGFKAQMVGHGAVMLLVARNAGRAAAWIEQTEFLQGDGRNGVGGTWISGPPLPHRLDAGASASWALNYTEARQWMAENFASADHHWIVRASARLGSSARFRTDWRPVWIWEPGYMGKEIPPRGHPTISRRQLLWLYVRHWLKLKDPILRWDGQTWQVVTDRGGEQA